MADSKATKGAEGTAAAAPAGSKMDQATLEKTLKAQVEFYFSKENISNDAFLVSQMNADKQVAVSVIARFNKVKDLLSQSEDKDLLVKVMRKCANCIVDDKGELVKPKLKKPQRNTLILREIPQSTSEDLIRGIFAHKECGKVVDLRSEIGDMWFVTFEDEKKCMDTFMFLMGKQFQGKPIRCRVKQESMLRSYYAPPQQQQQQQSGNDRWRQPAGGAQGGYQYGGQPVYFNQPYMPQQAYNQQWQTPQQQSQQQQQQQSQQQQQQQQQQGGRGGKQGGRGAQQQQNQQNSRDQQQQQKGGKGGKKGNQARDGKNNNGKESGKTAAKEKRGKDGKKGDKKKGDKKNQSKQAEKQVEFNDENFPGLPGAGGVEPPEPAGYTRDFKCYSRETLASVVQKLSKAGFARPSTFPADREGAEDNPGLVLRQKPIESCQLLELFPVMFPASPSPVLAAQPRATHMPALDLNKKKKKRGSVTTGRRKGGKDGKYATKKKAPRARKPSAAARAPAAVAKPAAAPAAGKNVPAPSGKWANLAAKPAAAKPAAKPAAATEKKQETKPKPAAEKKQKEAKPAKAEQPKKPADGKKSFADLLKK